MIQSIEDIDQDTKKFKCECEKSGKLFERIKPKDEKPSNTESAFCDEEIEKFKMFLKDKNYGGGCWCKRISEYAGGL